MSRRQKKIFAAAIILAVAFGTAPGSLAMHIMEGYLPPVYCVAWGVISAPFLVAGFLSIRKKLEENRRNITMLAMAGGLVVRIDWGFRRTPMIWMCRPSRFGSF